MEHLQFDQSRKLPTDRQNPGSANVRQGTAERDRKLPFGSLALPHSCVRVCYFYTEDNKPPRGLWPFKNVREKNKRNSSSLRPAAHKWVGNLVPRPVLWVNYIYPVFIWAVDGIYSITSSALTPDLLSRVWMGALVVKNAPPASAIRHQTPPPTPSSCCGLEIVKFRGPRGEKLSMLPVLRKNVQLWNDCGGEDLCFRRFNFFVAGMKKPESMTLKVNRP